MTRALPVIKVICQAVTRLFRYQGPVLSALGVTDDDFSLFDIIDTV